MRIRGRLPAADPFLCPPPFPENVSRPAAKKQTPPWD